MMYWSPKSPSGECSIKFHSFISFIPGIKWSEPAWSQLARLGSTKAAYKQCVTRCPLARPANQAGPSHVISPLLSYLFFTSCNNPVFLSFLYLSGKSIRTSDLKGSRLTSWWESLELFSFFWVCEWRYRSHLLFRYLPLPSLSSILGWLYCGTICNNTAAWSYHQFTNRKT